ncbi:MAG: 50S ribosomal protein L11 methyltransferase [Desulfotignum sp.]|nr:50S ribosomal protein L11 methyltransferase [Desulfotignum sp.]MCF8114347.1 50S ribosomal protein L11 methyltransferase [Desulfotignum sp.]MCF8125805.1 50S ribosomal protein L11 methyltransferase [Desulfotignum sp.]
MTPFDRAAVLAILENADTRMTARAYVREIAAAMQISLPCAKAILKYLVNCRDLAYQDLFGNTYVIENFQKPTRITNHFFLIPPGITSTAGSGEMDIRLLPGISFGSGHHPTTRLCLAAIDHLFFTGQPEASILQAPGADIGTGSGVLAIAICLAGVARCLAYDIDPNAVSEAKKNIDVNALYDKIPVFDHPLPGNGPGLGIICANLRTPTLAALAPLMRNRLKPGGVLVFSGIRKWEAKDLKTCFAGYRFHPVWEKTDKNWVGLILADHKKYP